MSDLVTISVENHIADVRLNRPDFEPLSGLQLGPEAAERQKITRLTDVRLKRPKNTLWAFLLKVLVFWM